MNRKPCSNVPTCLYSGSEKSPLGSGLSAEGFELNYEMMGIDKLTWVVNMKNNKKVWVRKYTNNSITYETPLISEEIQIQQPPPPQEIPLLTSKLEELEVNDDKPTPQPSDKKITDYNIFIKYTSKILKENNVDKKPNKVLQKEAVDQWNILKKNPAELKKVMNLIHQNKFV